MVRLLNEKSHTRDERINGREIQSLRLLWEDFSPKVSLYDISFCHPGGDGESADEFLSTQSFHCLCEIIKNRRNWPLKDAI